MATLAVQNAPLDGGLSVVFASAAGGGDQAPVGPGRFLVVKNDDASAVTVTVATGSTVRGLAVEDIVKSVAAGAVWIEPLPRMLANPSTGRAAITYSGVTDLGVAVVELV